MIPEEKDIYSIVFNQNLANTFFSLFLQIFYLILNCVSISYGGVRGEVI